MANMIVAAVKAISGRTVFEVQHVDGYKPGCNQTLSDPFLERKDAVEYMQHLETVKGTECDPLAHYWNRKAQA